MVSFLDLIQQDDFRNYVASRLDDTVREPHYPEYLSQMLTKLLKNAGLPQCRFRDLRHLCATIMVRQGVDVKTAQQRLGHKDIKNTLEIYAHVFASMSRDASDKIGELVYYNEAV